MKASRGSVGATLGATRMDVPGMVRRVRRICDFSQSDLAARLGVSRSTVARWELGETDPTVGMFQEILALGDLTLEALDPDGDVIGPMRNDTVRDVAGRRYPSHLDVLGFDTLPSLRPRSPETNRCAPRRRSRDRLRARRPRPIPRDHPSEIELAHEIDAPRALRNVRIHAARERRQAASRARGVPDPWEIPECTCRDDCFDVPGCVPHCDCRCERIVAQTDADTHA